MLRYFNGRRVTSYALADPPDGEDVRPGHDYQQFAGTGVRNEAGRLYVWDATHKRVLVFNKDDGAYIEQFVADGSRVRRRARHVRRRGRGRPAVGAHLRHRRWPIQRRPRQRARRRADAGAVGQRPVQPTAVVRTFRRAQRIARRLAVRSANTALHARPASPE